MTGTTNGLVFVAGCLCAGSGCGGHVRFTQTETTERLRWSYDAGLKLWCGTVGTLGSMFTIAAALIEGDPHLLMSSFPGQERKRRDSVDPDELKAEAERWLEEFVSSLGAVFPEPLLELADRWQQFAAKDDAADECARELREAIAGPGSVEDVVAASIEQQSAYRNELRHLPGYMAAPATPAPMAGEKESKP